MTLRVLDPRQLPEGGAPALAPALASLDGAVIGLLDNAKIGTARFYDHVDEILRSRYGVREFIRRRKPDTSRPAPPEMLAELSGADAIISGIGD
jgi:hypothetical protein